MELHRVCWSYLSFLIISHLSVVNLSARDEAGTSSIDN